MGRWFAMAWLHRWALYESYRTSFLMGVVSCGGYTVLDRKPAHKENAPVGAWCWSAWLRDPRAKARGKGSGQSIGAKDLHLSINSKTASGDSRLLD